MQYFGCAVTKVAGGLARRCCQAKPDLRAKQCDGTRASAGRGDRNRSGLPLAESTDARRHKLKPAGGSLLRTCGWVSDGSRFDDRQGLERVLSSTEP